MPTQTYNKALKEGHGTLIGNWQEESSLRELSEGSVDVHNADDTFRRIHGGRQYDPADLYTTTNMEFSKISLRSGDSRQPGRSHLQDRIDSTVKNTLDMMDPGLKPRAEADDRKSHFQALKERAEQLKRNEEALVVREYPGTSEAADSFRQPALSSRNWSELSKHHRREQFAFSGTLKGIAQGGKAPEMAHVPPACETQGGYPQTEAVTQWSTMAATASPPPMSPARGSLRFAKCTGFTCPPEFFYGGLHKEMDEKQRSEETTRRQLCSSDVVADVTPYNAGRPVTLAHVKKSIQHTMVRKLGGTAFAIFRKHLMLHRNAADTVPTEAVKHFLREIAGVTDATVDPQVLSAALSVISTTDSGTAPLEKIFEFFWPPLNEERRAALTDLLEHIRGETATSLSRGLPVPAADARLLPSVLADLISCGHYETDGGGHLSPQQLVNLLVDVQGIISSDKEFEGLAEATRKAIVTPQRVPKTLKEWYSTHGV